jgi:hypothetical protein
MDSGSSQVSLTEKVAAWLSIEGYPLEFRVTHIFRQQGFNAFQGQYIRGLETGSAREIDVVAQGTLVEKDSWVRVEYLVECKWSKDKPWVLFSSRRGMASSACITQTIGSETGRCLMWVNAGRQELHELNTFSVPERSGFGGRQAFSKKSDVFYEAMQGVTEKATARAKEFSEGDVTITDSLRAALVVLPLIVVEGELFEAYFDQNAGEVRVEPVTELRLHWRGSEAWKVHATVDIVTADSLERFVERRAAEVKTILSRMIQSMAELRECVVQRSMAPLAISPGPRGILGEPALLHRIRMHIKSSPALTPLTAPPPVPTPTKESS